uniref:Uncharacterized protein n=1 Tax=Oryza barthii TaxID=65489 RepID=A0A0D3GMX1_9ORYZ
MAETKIIHATKQAEDAVTKFIKSDIRNKQTEKCNIPGNNVKRSSSNTAEAPRHVVVTISSDAGQNTMVDNGVTLTQELTDKESDTKTKLLERGVCSITTKKVTIILVLFLVLGLILASTATWLARKHFAQVVALLALVPQVLVAGVITSTFS